MGVELKEHQKQPLEDMSNGCILAGGVGSGKSIVALAYYVKHESPRDIVVITTARKRDDLDWDGNAVKFGIGTRRSGTMHGVLTVDSWNNIQKYKEMENAFFIFDEQRVVGSGAWAKSFIRIAKNNRWILLSATPGDTWLDYIPLFIANGFYRNRTEFIDRHVVYQFGTKFPKVKKFLEVEHLENLLRRLMVDMPYEKHTVRHLERVRVEHDKERFQKAIKQRWNPFDDRPIKDVAELFRVMRKIVNEDPDRITQTLNLFQKHKKLIIFYNFDYELEALRDMCDNLWIDYAEWNGHRHEDVPEGDEWIYLVQYTAGSEAWECITTNAMLFYSLNYSYKVFEQSQGRIDRLNTPFTDLYYYQFVSESQIDWAILKAQRVKKDFNQRNMQLPKEWDWTY